MILTRKETSQEGTFGEIDLDGHIFTTCELPDKDNIPKISCIPLGTYQCVWHDSPSKGWVYKVLNVPNREDILIHVANWSGDKSAGYKSDVLGCIGLGTGIGILLHQKAILGSATAIKNFNAIMKEQPFELTIEKSY